VNTYAVPKFFNTAGPSQEDINYTLDPLRRIRYEEIASLIDQRRYFVLHAPRQTGKTTSLLAMVKQINEEGRYRCVYTNVESAQTERDNVAGAMRIIVSSLASQTEIHLGDARLMAAMNGILDTFGNGALGGALAFLSGLAPKPLVLFIDEIDSLIGDALVSVLRQLREGYANRPTRFPTSIILCGVRDIRDYRIHTSAGEIITGGSCFNVKAESLRLGDFSPGDIRELYEQHTKETGQVFADDIYPKVWDLTHGQPWLVNALAHQATSKIPEGRDRKNPITLDMIEDAAERLILERATHLDQLVDKLKEERVRRVVVPILAGDAAPRNIPPDDLQYVIDLGLVRVRPSLDIANDIYREVIPRELTWTTQAYIAKEQAWYVNPDGSLDMDLLLDSFQQFFRENSESWLERFDYKEAGFQLLLQAFLQRIVNGGGLIAREYALGRGRVDLNVRWRYPHSAPRRAQKEQKIVLELKTIREKGAKPEKVLSDGLEQTARCAAVTGAAEAHLLICDERPGHSWDEKIYRRTENFDGREIFVWGV